MKITTTEPTSTPAPIKWSDIKPNSMYRHSDGSIIVVPQLGPAHAIAFTNAHGLGFIKWGFDEGKGIMWKALTPITTPVTITLSTNETSNEE